MSNDSELGPIFYICAMVLAVIQKKDRLIRLQSDIRCNADSVP